MKFSGQTKDGAIDNLLRAYVSRPSSLDQICADFDPDLANSYVERRLTGAPRLRFERHLSECTACRKSVVALARFADADSLTTTTTPLRQVTRSTWLSGLRQMLGALSQPQWAMAATAVIVLAVSVPLFLSSDKSRSASPQVAEQATADKASEAAPPSNGLASRSGQQVAPALAMASKPSEKSDDKTEAAAKNAPGSYASTETASGVAAGVELSKKAEFKSNLQTADESQQRKLDAQSSQAPAQAGAAPSPAPQVAKAEAEQTRQQQPEKDAAQQAGEPKVAARTDEDQRARERAEKEKSEKVEDAAAPPAPPPSSEVARGRSTLRRGRLSLRDSGAVEAVRPEERKLSGKKFLFKDGAWTDKDFDPNKDLPIVTIIRDSNVYKEVLNKRPGLKPFLAGFPATERAIIVYKGTVYKLIPQ